MYVCARACVCVLALTRIRYNLGAAQAEEFLAEAVKHLEWFRESAEYGWTEVQKDVRRFIKIKTKRYNAENSIKSYPSALRGDGKINIAISLSEKKKVYLFFDFNS